KITEKPATCKGKSGEIPLTSWSGDGTYDTTSMGTPSRKTEMDLRHLWSWWFYFSGVCPPIGGA
ncbi:MAG: hypothetical protein ACREJJ_04945, partial [Candidatus Methylomirabilales bacterium]